jgi:hypothetical protein
VWKVFGHSGSKSLKNLNIGSHKTVYEAVADCAGFRASREPGDTEETGKTCLSTPGNPVFTMLQTSGVPSVRRESESCAYTSKLIHCLGQVETPWQRHGRPYLYSIMTRTLCQIFFFLPWYNGSRLNQLHSSSLLTSAPVK